jgi:L-arabinose isomerase
MNRSVVPDLATHEVWFLTGSQTLYGEAVLEQVATQSQQVASMLDASPDVPCRIVWKPVLTSREAILDIMHAANSAPKVVGLMTWMHTFSPAKMWIAGLSALDKPLLHLHTQANSELPWATIDFDFMNLNQAAHGDREFAYIETRLGVARTTVVGHCSDRAVTERVGDWCRAAAGRLAAHNMSVARFGDNMRFVAVTEGDKTEAEAVFGSQINTWVSWIWPHWSPLQPTQRSTR